MVENVTLDRALAREVPRGAGEAVDQGEMI